MKYAANMIEIYLENVFTLNCVTARLIILVGIIIGRKQMKWNEIKNAHEGSTELDVLALKYDSLVPPVYHI